MFLKNFLFSQFPNYFVNKIRKLKVYGLNYIISKVEPGNECSLISKFPCNVPGSDPGGFYIESFRCVLTNWDYIYNLCRNISREIKNSGYEPDVIIALARGGWFAGRVLCDFLGLDDLSSLKIEHYIGTAAIDTGEPYIRYPLSNNVMEGKKCLS